MKPGENKAHKSHVWTTARQQAFQNSSNSLQRLGGDITAEAETDQILHYISEVLLLFFLWFVFFFFDCCLIFLKHSTEKITTKSQLDYGCPSSFLRQVTVVVKTLVQYTQNLHAGARYLPRLGALAVLLLFFILKKPRPNEDLALRVPKLSSSPVPPWEGDFGGRVAKLLPSTGGLTCSS